MRFETALALWLCVASGLPLMAQADPDRTLYYAGLGSGMVDDRPFRTIFHLMNESDQAVVGELRFFARNGDALTVEVSSTWVGDSGPGSLQFPGAVIDFSIPSRASLELAMILATSPKVGMARLDFSGALESRVVVQVGRFPSGPGPLLESFEHYIESEAEVFPATGLKTFSFPILLFRGVKEINTAFSMVNLSAAPGKVRLILRPENEKIITLQPGQSLADYFDHFWEIAVIEIFPFRLLTTAEVSSDVLLSPAVFRTVEGLPLAGVQVVSTPLPEQLIEAQLAEEFQLTINQTGSIQSESLRLTFWDVTEESRCPVDVNCIQAGRTTLTVQVSQQGSDPVELSLSTDLDNSVIFDRYALRLVRVDPDPVSTRTIDMSEYRVTLVVTENP
ncbi:MAG: hypothetical protein V3R94_05160 [Acidobacteriota bacterium]